MINVFVAKGDRLDGENMTLRSDDQIRVSISNTWENHYIMFGMNTAGKITLKVKKNITDTTAAPETVFEGTYEEFLARLV